MSEKYTPRVGDKVRATLGENVLVGTVTQELAGGLVELVVATDEEVVLSVDCWQFGQVVSVPSKFGAVIRRADGRVFALIEPNDVLAWFVSNRDRWARQDEATAGGFTVLFDGVDE